MCKSCSNGWIDNLYAKNNRSKQHVSFYRSICTYRCMSKQTLKIVNFLFLSTLNDVDQL